MNSRNIETCCWRFIEFVATARQKGFNIAALDCPFHLSDPDQNPQCDPHEVREDGNCYLFSTALLANIEALQALTPQELAARLGQRQVDNFYIRLLITAERKGITLSENST